LGQQILEHFEVAVIGAGISGCATAFALAKAVAHVVLIDRFGPAAMASGWTLAGVRQSGRDPAELPLAMEAVDRHLTFRLSSSIVFLTEAALPISNFTADADRFASFQSGDFSECPVPSLFLSMVITTYPKRWMSSLSAAASSERQPRLKSPNVA
jgi:glycine/D-amino acid oxidase-like deaminating enzyme